MINKFEKECNKYLKSRFEEVHWKSKSNPKAHNDFLCYNNGLTFTVEAKTTKGKEISVSPYQLDCALFLIKRDNNFILCSLKTLKERLSYNIRVVKLKLSKELEDIGK